MEREKLRELLRRWPFQPFRVHLTEGQKYDVLYPDMHILGEIHINIGLPEPNMPDPYCDDSVIVMLSQISRVEMLPAAANFPTSVGG